jgi:hypothetical protein
MMNQEKSKPQIPAQLFEPLPPGSDKKAMLERATAILVEVGRRPNYEGSIAVGYADEALEILNHPNYDEKKDTALNGAVENLEVFSNVARGQTVSTYCKYLLERARENYVNEKMGDHGKIAAAVMKFLESK